MKDRIDDWWIQSPPQDSGKRALVEDYEGTLKLGEAPQEVLGLHDERGETFLDNAADVIEEFASQREAVKFDSSDGTGCMQPSDDWSLRVL